MGNKHVRKVHDKLVEAFDKKVALARYLPFTALSEHELATHLEKIIKKKLTEDDWSNLEKAMNLNITPQESKGELEQRSKKTEETRLYSLLVSGHEGQAETIAAFQGVQLEDTLAPKLSWVQSFSRRKVMELVVAVLVLAAKAEDESGNFYQRASQCLAEGPEELAQGSGVSIALCLSALLMDPKKLAKDESTSLRMLKMFGEMPSLALHGWSRQNFVIDRSIGYVKDCLLEQLKSAESQKSLSNGIKTLCHIGLVRGSVGDLLMGVRLMKEDMDLGEVLRKVLELDRIGSSGISLESSEQNYKIPFEQIYVSDKNLWLTDKDAKISSATDGNYVYFYNPKHGLMLLGAGNETIKGKLYKAKGLIENKTQLQLLCLKKKLYCHFDNKLFKLNADTMQTKQSKKTDLVKGLSEYKLAASDDRLVIYKEEKQTEEEVKAEITIHDFSSNSPATKITVAHSIKGIQELTLYKNLLILTSKGRYEVIDLLKRRKLCGGESKILSQSTLSCNPLVRQLFAVYATTNDEGLVFEEFGLPTQEEGNLLLDAKVEEVRAGIDKNENKDMTKSEVEFLLGMTRRKAEEVKSDAASGAENLLALLAHRAKAAELYMENMKGSKEIIKAYKCPVATHLTAECLETLFNLLEEQYKKFTVSDKPLVELEKLWYVIIILNSHFIALRTCDVALEDLVGSESADAFKQLVKDIMVPLMQENLAEKRHVENQDLIKQVKEYATHCLNNSKSEYKAGIEDIFKQLHKFNENKLAKDKLNQVINWLKVSDNCELLASKLFSQDKDALAFLNEYFETEVKHFTDSVQAFIKSEDIKDQGVHKELLKPLSAVIEKLFINKQCMKGNKMVVTVLPEMLHPYLKRVVLEVKESYGQYKEYLGKNLKELKEGNNLGPKYASYWKFIDKLLNQEMIMFSCFTYLTAAVMGSSMIPDELITLAKLLVKSTNPLKELVNILAQEKMNKDFFLHELEETFENEEKPIKSSISTSKEYTFPEATGIRIHTVESIEIPLPEDNSIKILIPLKEGPEVTISRSNPSCKLSVKSSQITISATVNYVYSEKNLPYNGFALKVAPKVSLPATIVRLRTKNPKRNIKEDTVADMLRGERGAETLRKPERGRDAV